MKQFSLKALGASILLTGLVVVGMVSPAAAASAASATAIVVPGSTNTAETVITFGALPSSPAVANLQIRATSGVSFTVAAQSGTQTLNGTWQACGASTNVFIRGSSNTPVNCYVMSGAVNIQGREGSGPFTLNTADLIEIKLGAGSMNFSPSGTFSILAAFEGTAASTISSTSFTLTDPNAPVVYTSAYSGNGGTGSSPTPGSSSSGSITLPANTYTKAGFTFAGWRSGSATVGTIYQAGSSAPLTANTTFYAQWTDNSSSGGSSSSSSNSSSLANTGINTATGISLLVGGASLALVGAELLLIARRKRSN